MTASNFVVPLIVVGMLLWPVIINSQPGTKYVVLGIDWKADNLDNTLFWTAIILMILTSVVSVANEKQKEQIQLKVAREHNFRSGV